MKNIFKIIQEEIKKLNEVSDEMYDLINTKYTNKRIILSQKDKMSFENIDTQRSGAKPIGLWYGIGNSWIDWVRNEMPEWEYDNVFELKINESKILMISNMNELMEFNNMYLDDNPMNFNGNIDWREVSKKYSGIEIAPFIWKGRNELNWYYSWDVASGCIWKSDAIISIDKIV